MNEQVPQEDCIDVLGDFFERYGADDRVQVMGGIGAAALIDPDTRILYSEKRIEVSDSFHYPLVRKDGTMRDADVFVRSANIYELQTVKQVLERTLDGRLKPSLFGVHSAAELASIGHSPFGVIAPLQYVSDRYVLSDKESAVVKAIYPFVARIDEESLEPWTLVARGYEFKVPNPGVATINYMNRSVSGVRERDAEKTAVTLARFNAEAPEMISYMVSGPGRSQFELARAMHSVGVGMEPLNNVLGSALAQAPMTRREIAESELVEYAHLSPHRLNRALGAFAVKAKAVRFFEGIPWLHKAW